MPNNSMLRNGLSGAKMGAGVGAVIGGVLGKKGLKKGLKRKPVNQGIKNMNTRNQAMRDAMQ